MQGPKSYVTAPDLPAYHQPQVADSSSQQNSGLDEQKNGIEQPMEVLEGVPNCSKLQSLL